jgi:YhcH/YjgK/YiaL family protein
MIIDTLENAKIYYALHPAFKEAFAFLCKSNPRELKDGKYELNGKKLFATVAVSNGRGKDDSKLEFHRKFIDIQYCVSGVDVIGWLSLADCFSVDQKYNKKKDFGILKDTPQAWFALTSGRFVIFFPEDAHAPLAGNGAVRKVVVKVAV